MVELRDTIIGIWEWLGPDFDLTKLFGAVAVLIAFLTAVLNKDALISNKAKETGEKKSVLTCSNAAAMNAAGSPSLTLTFVSRGQTSLTDVDIRIRVFADQNRDERLAADQDRFWFRVLPKDTPEECVLQLAPTAAATQTAHVCCAYDYKLFNGDRERGGESFDVAIPSSSRPVMLPLPTVLCREMLRR